MKAHNATEFDDASLLLIDIQRGFDNPKWGKRNNVDAEKNMAKLMRAWRKKHNSVFHVKNNSIEKDSPLRPGLPGNEIKSIVKPLDTEPLLVKSVNSAFIGTDLEKRLRREKITTLVIVGLTTDHCVSTTARMAGNLGFETYVVSDATATFDRRYNGKYYTAEMMHDFTLASLNNEFATIIETKQLLSLFRN